jgi:hypothetical protein
MAAKQVDKKVTEKFDEPDEGNYLPLPLPKLSNLP